MKNKTIREAWQKGFFFLQQSGTDSPQFEAEYMMRRLLGVERAAFLRKWPILGQSVWNPNSGNG